MDYITSFEYTSKAYQPNIMWGSMVVANNSLVRTWANITFLVFNFIRLRVRDSKQGDA